MKNFNIFNLFQISLDAGKEILKIYRQDFNVEYKEDDSPLTQADKHANDVIIKGLNAMEPKLPILSEEGKSIPYDERKQWNRYWLVDPLDGTKEFIKKNGEFTVNIAMVEGRFPSIGVIYAPALDLFYFGCAEFGAYKLKNASKAVITNEQELFANSVRLPELVDNQVVRVVASRSHMTQETEAFIKELEEKYGEVEIVSSGSSLKFCLVAEGKADFYPRYAPTMEWDTGAGQAIVEAVGGKVIRYEDNTRFYYNRENLLNGWFLAVRS